MGMTAKELEEFVQALGTKVSTHKLSVTIQTPRAKRKRKVVRAVFDVATASLLLVTE